MSTKKKTPTQEKQTQPKQPAKPKMRKVRYAVLSTGARHEILREDGKYIYCTDTTIRLADSRLIRVESQMIPVEGGD